MLKGGEEHTPIFAHPNMKSEQLTICNKLQELTKLPDFLENFCSDLPISPMLVLSINLALEEAMVNCVNYAYPTGTTGDISLSICWNAEQQALNFTLSDAGAPFDPTAAPAPDTDSGAEDRPIGGLGIFLVRQIMDSVCYHREGNLNILTMCKKAA